MTPMGGGGGSGTPGPQGLSAYQVAVANGYSGTESQWLVSLVGAAGQDGADGEQGPQGNPGSDASVTKANVEAVLTGTISSHSHAGGGGLQTLFFFFDV